MASTFSASFKGCKYFVIKRPTNHAPPQRSTVIEFCRSVVWKSRYIESFTLSMVAIAKKEAIAAIFIKILFAFKRNVTLFAIIHFESFLRDTLSCTKEIFRNVTS